MYRCKKQGMREKRTTAEFKSVRRTDTKAGGHTNRATNRQMDRQIHKQTDRQTDRQTDTQTDR